MVIGRVLVNDLDQRIEDIFADRVEHDESYDPPERPEDFSFDDYRMFMMRNLDYLPPRLSQEPDMVESLLEDLRETRNALIHFRADADEVDRDRLDMPTGTSPGLPIRCNIRTSPVIGVQFHPGFRWSLSHFRTQRIRTEPETYNRTAGRWRNVSNTWLSDVTQRFVHVPH